MFVPHEHLIQCAVLFGTAKRHHLVAVHFIPPGTRALESHMTDARVGRCDAPTAQGIAASTERALVGVLPMCLERVPTMRQHFFRFCGPSLHASPSPEHRTHLPHIQPRHRRFGPCEGLPRGALVGVGPGMDIIDTVVRVEDWTGMSTQRLDVCP